jgi:excisionase family DNA binding protein
VSERLLTARELGQLLSFSAATIVDWAEAGKLPAFKIGGRLRFRLSEVEAWLEERRCVPRASMLPRAVHGRTVQAGRPR